MTRPKASVILSVYNRFDFLQLVLAGLEIQTEPDFEVIISDDGSHEAFINQLATLRAVSPLRISHNWHPDTGFLKNRILNVSIRSAQGAQLIFLDGDCIPHPAFVAEHLALGGPDRCLAGRRIDLSDRLTRQLTPVRVRQGVLQSPYTAIGQLIGFLTRRTFHFMNGLYVTNPLLRSYFNRKERGLLGANFSVMKADLEAINGFDERYNAPTFGEDSDVEFRLRLNGVKVIPVLNIAVTYHCHHKLLPRPEANRALYEHVVRESQAFTPYGLVQ
ncbi:glycosyltransferase [Hymenobacter sp. H14-R3]|uniref:glycosyltransferase n=1 Tax=Hymenobacter sp. H14-R3 TaxID=3046308 RepID=UPI0024BBACD3|nr:glycosyltransferase [Hymenobacter sp. H14-R3]MDJ0363740.1 glycosyltransferase [Hymenobacter sp. H14-R3]